MKCCERINRWQFGIGMTGIGLVGVVAVFGASQYPEHRDMCMNVSAEIFGILLTILSVNWLLELREKRRWAGTHSRLEKRALLVARAARGGMAFSLELSPDILKPAVRTGGVDVADEILRQWCSKQSDFALRELLCALPDDRRRSLIHTLQETSRNADTIWMTFSRELGSEVSERLLDIGTSASDAASGLQFWCDVAGVRADSAIDLAFAGGVAADVGRMLEAAQALVEIIRSRPPIADGRVN